MAKSCGVLLSRSFVLAYTLLLLCIGGAPAFAAEPTPPLDLGWVYPHPPPAGWSHLSVPAARSVLWYPPSMRPIRGGAGNSLASVTVTPNTFAANMSPQGEKLRIGWPRFWLGQLGKSATAIHEDASSLGAVFKGAIGACVMADYVTRTKAIPSRAIACLVQGSADSVVVAAVQTSAWTQLGPQLELAISSYQVKFQ